MLQYLETRIRFRIVNHRSHGLVSQGEKFGYTCAGRDGFGERPFLRTERNIRIACVPP
jgi:hypothetical protein